jgi:hypothetical protein
VYTPEEGMTLDMLRDDVKFLKRRYALDEKGKAEGRIVIKYIPDTVTGLYLTKYLGTRLLQVSTPLKC